MHRAKRSASHLFNLQVNMSFTYRRTIRFADTDAAGVVYFANVLSICHEAYEASLAAAGIDLNQFFRGAAAMPIVHAEIDYLQPLFCGETYAIELSPTLLKPDKFEIHYTIRAAELAISRAKTLHLCIDSTTRRRMPLPPDMQRWFNSIPSNLDIPSPSPQA